MYFQSIGENIAFWTSKLNTLADTTGLHSILVMASLPTTMKVIVANQQPIYHVNDEGPKSVQSGCHELYCERVVNTKKPLLIKDASVEQEWMNNEDLVKFGLGTYLGLPLIIDDVAVGTICALHNQCVEFEAGSPSIHQQLMALKVELETQISASIKMDHA